MGEGHREKRGTCKLERAVPEKICKRNIPKQRDDHWEALSGVGWCEVGMFVCVFC